MKELQNYNVPSSGFFTLTKIRFHWICWRCFFFNGKSLFNIQPPFWGEYIYIYIYFFFLRPISRTFTAAKSTFQIRFLRTQNSPFRPLVPRWEASSIMLRKQRMESCQKPWSPLMKRMGDFCVALGWWQLKWIFLEFSPTILWGRWTQFDEQISTRWFKPWPNLIPYLEVT